MPRQHRTGKSSRPWRQISTGLAVAEAVERQIRERVGSSIIAAVERAHARGEALPQHITREEQERLITGERSGGKRGNRKGAFPTEPFSWSPPGRTMHLTLPGYLPPSANQYARSKGVRMRAVGEAVDLIGRVLLLVKDEKRSFYRPRLEIRLWFPTRRRRDSRTNWTKVLEDALVESGLMVDDSDEWCDTQKPVIDADRDRPRTEIWLEEVER